MATSTTRTSSRRYAWCSAKAPKHGVTRRFVGGTCRFGTGLFHCMIVLIHGLYRNVWGSDGADTDGDASPNDLDVLQAEWEAEQDGPEGEGQREGSPTESDSS